MRKLRNILENWGRSAGSAVIENVPVYPGCENLCRCRI
jgi:hypothetical protein